MSKCTIPSSPPSTDSGSKPPSCSSPAPSEAVKAKRGGIGMKSWGCLIFHSSLSSRTRVVKSELPFPPFLHPNPRMPSTRLQIGELQEVIMPILVSTWYGPSWTMSCPVKPRKFVLSRKCKFTGGSPSTTENVTLSAGEKSLSWLNSWTAIFCDRVVGSSGTGGPLWRNICIRPYLATSISPAATNRHATAATARSDNIDNMSGVTYSR
mmetsp:Transcript_18509/g.44519  ORF Transcript_18509/g.44519 Transcript_18509/m.44519 type:complete len:209 (-) Transcript_18509:69-695(-)